MSYVYDDCKKVLEASEANTLQLYFRNWLKVREDVPRTTKSAMLTRLDEFEKEMEEYYVHRETVGSILNPGCMQTHVDNLLLDMLKSGLDVYCNYVRDVISKYPTDRISRDKLLKQLDDFVASNYACTLKMVSAGRRIENNIRR